MTDEYISTKESEAFEQAFAKFETWPTRSYVRQPTPKDQIPLPWYLDKDSGGEPQSGS